MQNCNEDNFLTLRGIAGINTIKIQMRYDIMVMEFFTVLLSTVISGLLEEAVVPHWFGGREQYINNRFCFIFSFPLKGIHLEDLNNYFMFLAFFLIHLQDQSLENTHKIFTVLHLNF